MKYENSHSTSGSNHFVMRYACSKDMTPAVVGSPIVHRDSRFEASLMLSVNKWHNIKQSVLMNSGIFWQSRWHNGRQCYEVVGTVYFRPTSNA